jgi:hypothetical protein
VVKEDQHVLLADRRRVGIISSGRAGVGYNIGSGSGVLVANGCSYS